MRRILTATVKGFGLFALALSLALVFEPVRVVAQTYIDQLRRPKIINGPLTFPNIEQVDNNTDDMIEFQGVGGTDDTDLRIDLDGTRPVIDSPTDTTVEIADALVIGGILTLPNGETIDNANDDFIEFQGAAGTDNTDIRVDLDGTHPIWDSPTDARIDFAEDTIGLGSSNGEMLVMSADDVFDFTREDAGAVTLTCSDNDATCALIVDPGGAAALTLGSADVTAISLLTDNTGDGTDVVLPAQSVNGGEVLNDTLDWAQVAAATTLDEDTAVTMGDGIEWTWTVAHTAGDAEALTINVDQADDANATDDFDAIQIGLATESGDAGDTIEGIVLLCREGAANTIFDAAIRIDNLETTAATLTDAILVTSSGVNAGVTDGIDVSAANIVNAVNIGINPIAGGNGDSFQAGAADATFLYTRDTAGAVTYAGADDAAPADTVYDTTGAGICFVGSADVTDVVALAAETRIRNGAAGNVLLGFQDFADTADDDQDHGQILVNCTDAASGTEDCDFSIGVAEGGAVPEARLVIDADGGATLGSANNNSVTLQTDGAGDAEVALSENSIGPDEVAVFHDSIIFCGDQANAGTVYTSPVLTFLGGDYTASYAMASVGCNAEDDAVEANADEPVGFANTTFKVTGMLCEVTSAGANGVVLTARSAAAGLTPAVTCTVPTGSTTCSTVVGSTTDIAAGATVAVQATNSEDLSAQDFWCKLGIAWK